MKIDGISLQAQPFIKPKTPDQLKPEVEETHQDSHDHDEIEEHSIIDSQSEIQEIDTEKGVLRNLLEGHFKGVSDLRLRINFFDELEEIEGEKLQTVVAEKVGDVLESIADVVESFFDDVNELTEEQIPEVMELHEKFTHDAGEYHDEPIDELTDIFEEFVEALRDLLTPPEQIHQEDDAHETENDDMDEDDTTVELPWQTFLNNLQTAFTAAADELTKAVTDLQILPELSEPNGNGVAYEKFLAIYNDLHGLGTSAEQPISEPVDLVV